MYDQVFQFFGLRENPFGVTPDPRFYVATPGHDAAFAKLILSIDAPQGFIVLTGEPGTGKTTLLNHFLNWLRRRERSTSYVFHPRLKTVELFDCILRDFGVPHESGDKGQLLAALCRWLIERQAMGDTPIVVIDEAQAISVRTLDHLRLLLNLQAAGRNLLQIVLVGQPELEDKLRRPELRRLRQRVTCHCHLQPLSLAETSQYVNSRLASMGAQNLDIFAPESLAAIDQYARGIPRTVNLLCEQALVTGYAEGAKIISADIIRQVAAEFDFTSQWEAADEHGLSARFRQLTPLGPEVRSVEVEGESAAIESTPQTMRAELASEILPLKPMRLPKAEPTPIVEEPKPQAPLAAKQVNEPRPPAVPTLPHVIGQLAKQPENPKHARTKLLVGWQGPRLGKRSVQYWKEARAGIQGGWKRLINKYAVAKPLFKPVAAAKPVPHVVQAVAKLPETPKPVTQTKLPVGWQRTRMGERWVQYWKEARAGIQGGWKRLRNKHAAIKLLHMPAAAAKPVPHVVQAVAKLPETPKPVTRTKVPLSWQRTRLGERSVQYWKEGRAVVTREWKRVMNESATAMEKARVVFARDWKQFIDYQLTKFVNKLLAAAKTTLPQIRRKTEKPAEEQKQVALRKNPARGRRIHWGEQCVRYCREVRDSFARDWNLFIHKSAVTRPGKEPLASAIPDLPRGGPTMAKPPEDVEHETPSNAPAIVERSKGRERFAGYRKSPQDSFERSLEQFGTEHAASTQATKTAAATRPTLPYIVRHVPNPAGDRDARTPRKSPGSSERVRLDERFVRYWKVVLASFVHDWKQFMGADRTAWIAARRRH